MHPGAAEQHWLWVSVSNKKNPKNHVSKDAEQFPFCPEGGGREFAEKCSKLTAYSFPYNPDYPITFNPDGQSKCKLFCALLAIAEVGGVPYEILEPVLERCTPEQLYRIELSNQVIHQTKLVLKTNGQNDLTKRRGSASNLHKNIGWLSNQFNPFFQNLLFSENLLFKLVAIYTRIMILPPLCFTEVIFVYLSVFYGRVRRPVEAPLPARLQARVSSGVRVVEGDVPAAARRAGGAAEDAHPEHHLCTCQQTQRQEKILNALKNWFWNAIITATLHGFCRSAG